MSFGMKDLLAFDVFFMDFDGTLVDSETIHFHAHREALLEQGFDLTKKFYAHHGLSRDPRLFYEDALGRKIDDELHTNIQGKKNQVFNEMIEKKLKPISCAVKLLKFLKNKNKKVWITSSSDNKYVRDSTRELGVFDIVDGFVCGDSEGVKGIKPAPDIFNLAIKLSNSTAEKILVIEDSSSGSLAAQNANLKCLVFPNEFTNLQKFPDSAIISSCSELMSNK